MPKIGNIVALVQCHFGIITHCLLLDQNVLKIQTLVMTWQVWQSHFLLQIWHRVWLYQILARDLPNRWSSIFYKPKINFGNDETFFQPLETLFLMSIVGSKCIEDPNIGDDLPSLKKSFFAPHFGKRFATLNGKYS